MNQKASVTDWIKFVVVMLVFIVGMIIMMVHEVHNLWIWGAYIAVWTWLEMKIAGNIHLKWWVWGLILLGLTGLDLIIISMIH
ncbi:MAG: hypothetical protein AAFO96_25395 [Bacteroidota bacterium]